VKRKRKRIRGERGALRFGGCLCVSQKRHKNLSPQRLFINSNHKSIFRPVWRRRNVEHTCVLYHTPKMRSTLRLLASTSNSSIGNPLRPLPLALLPPIPLYRRILRAHRRYLQHEQRVLGDLYVKSEFRAHRQVDNPVHIVSAS